MESSTLKQFLQSICCNSPWKYAVFWKLQQHNQISRILTLEDHYCQTPKLRNSIEGMLDDTFFKGSEDIFSSRCHSKPNDENMGTDPVELALAYMANTRYTLADGIVGEVACSGKYRWAFCDDFSCGAFSSKLPKCPDGWIFQFTAGIKTVLLVPVVPHGVLQLGSLETVAKDQALVANVADKFLAYQEYEQFFLPFSESIHLPAYSASSVMCNPVDNIMPDITRNGIKLEQSNDVCTIKKQSPMFPTPNQIRQPNKTENLREDNLEYVLKGSTSIIGDIIVQDQLQAFSDFSNDNVGAFGGYATNQMSSSDRGPTSQSLVEKDAGDFGNFFSFPRDCELHKALGSTIMGQANIFVQDTPLSAEGMYDRSNLISGDDFTYNTEPTVWQTSSPWVKDDGENLLELLLADVDCSFNNNISDTTAYIKPSASPLQQLSAFPKQLRRSEMHKMAAKDAEPQSCVTSAFTNRMGKASTSSSPSALSFESVMSALIGEENQKKGRHSTHPRKSSKLSSDNKRKSQSGGNHKPRPRDRQLIQDRLKELRDLVPDGVKCSIDGLLDKTIQHMLFLRRVTDQADKLRQLTHQEEPYHEQVHRIETEAAQGKDLKCVQRKGGQQNGTSWAYELGSEQQICPIIVEDLECPGNMLIEMLCGDHGNFLDIAEVIRRLGLTILKGEMENHSGSTWARFIVEVPRGFHRLDIFWPLMQLLQ